MSFRSTLYVGNVAYNSREADLTNLFSQYGTVLSTEIKRGFAFVKFETVEAAQASAQALDNHEFNGRNLKVNFSKSEPHPSNRAPFQAGNNNVNINQNVNVNPLRPPRVSFKENSIHVANLSHSITEETLQQTFEEYGILSIHIIRTRKICFAIIELSSEENTAKAIEEKTNFNIDGGEVVVTKQVSGFPERHNNFASRGRRGGRGFRGLGYRRGFGRGNFQRRNEQTFLIDNNLHHNNNINKNNNANNINNQINTIDNEEEQTPDFYNNNKYRGNNYRYRGGNGIFGGRGNFGGRGQFRGAFRARGGGSYQKRGSGRDYPNINNNL